MITDFNPSAEATFGYSRSEVLGLEMAEIVIPHRFREAHRKGLARYIAHGMGSVVEQRLELSALKRDGTEFPVEITITRLPVDPPIFTGFIRDITERKEAERLLQMAHENLERLVEERTAQLRKSEERFRLMVMEVKDYAIFILDPTGHIATWNAGARRIKGYTESEIIGQHFSKFYPQADIDAKKPEMELRLATAEGLEPPTWSAAPGRFLGRGWWVTTMVPMHAWEYAGTPVSLQRRGVYLHRDSLINR